MACVIVPAAEAVITTIVAKALEAKEKKSEKDGSKTEVKIEKSGKIPFSRKVKWLSNLLWGGSALLAFEHVWHGEISPLFPFLTGAASAEGILGILREMATAGVCMSALVTAVWLVMVAVTSAVEKRAQKEDAAAAKESV